MKRKFLAAILGMAVLASLTGCGDNQAADQEKENAAVVKEDATVSDSASGQQGDVLVAYFAVAENSDVDAVASASVSDIGGETKGRIRALAEMIREKTGGDLFSIQTSVEYPGNIGDLIDYAQEEQDNGERPELTSHIENLDDYSVVFVGYAGGIIGLN